MKKISFVLAFVVAFGLQGFARSEGSWYELSKTITIAPGGLVRVSVNEGKITATGEETIVYPDVVDTVPEWLKPDLALSFHHLAKSPTRITPEACIQAATLIPENQEILVISGSGKPPTILKLPSLDTIKNLIPPNIDPTSKLSFADLDNDGSSDLVVCPKNGGWYYLLGPTFTVPVKGVIDKLLARKPLTPLTNPSNPSIAKPLTGSIGLAYLDSNGTLKTVNQGQVVSEIPNGFGSLCSIGLVFVDAAGDLRVFRTYNRNPLLFSSKSQGILPSFDGEIHLSLVKDTLWVGTLDGDLFACKKNKDGQFIPDEKPFKTDLGRRLCPQITDIDGNGSLDLVYSNETGVFIAKTSNWSKPEKISEFKGAIAVSDLTGDNVKDIAIADPSGAKILAGPKFTLSNKTLIGACGTQLSLATGDIEGDSKSDIIAGDKDGKLCRLFVSADPKTPVSQDTTLADIDVGDFAAPCLGDVDGDSSNELIIANVDGKIICYKLTNGMWMEYRSWSLVPTYPINSVSDYFLRYYKEAELLSWEDDPGAVDAYVKELQNCKLEYQDEIAFCIGHTSPEVLRVMVRMGQAGIFARNAKAIYDIAPKLSSYVEIIEHDGWTTCSYRTGGSRMELPRDDYYWYVVHPRILYEVPVAINSSWWDKTPEQYGITREQWWQHNENIYLNQEKASFWREEMTTDTSFGESFVNLAANADSLEKAREKMHNLLYPTGNFEKDPRHNIFGYLTNDLFPWLIFKKAYGSCGEQSIMHCAVSRTLLIPCMVVVDRGEDHQWNETWMAGEWHHVEPSGDGKSYDQPWVYEVGWGKTVSDITSWRGDDNHFSTIPTVYKTKPNDRPTVLSYTETGKVVFKITDSNNKPVEAALISVRSGWNGANSAANWEYTNFQGICTFNLGFEPYYIVDCVTPYGITGLSRLVIKEGQTYNITLQVPGIQPENHSTTQEPQSEGNVEMTLSEIKDELRPPNYITSTGYRLGSYLSEKFGYRGVLFFRREVETTPQIVNGRELKKGDTLTIGEGIPTTFQNPSLFTYKIVTVKVRIKVDEFRLKFTPKTDTIKVPSGSSFDLAMDIDHTTPLTKLEWSWDEKEWNLLPLSGARIETGLGGAPSPGIRTITVRACALFEAGTKCETIKLKVELTPTNNFKDQPVFQDPPNPLDGASWKIGPFKIASGERYLLVTTSSMTNGLDLDIFLYQDKNSNGKPDEGEQIASSNGPTSSERILMTEPKEGPYILVCQGCTCPPEGGKFNVKLSTMPSW